MSTLTNVQAQYSAADNRIRVTGQAGPGIEVRVLVNPTLGSYTQARDIYDHFATIPALAKGTGVGPSFTVNLNVAGSSGPFSVYVATSDAKLEQPLVPSLSVDQD